VAKSNFNLGHQQPGSNRSKVRSSM